MKDRFVVATPLWGVSRTARRAAAIVGLFCAVISHEGRAQVGNNNPTGVSGIFNGNITTGGSYDPYTGNAIRTVTDIVVAGAVGEYPLALSRSYNSRNAWGGAFGLPGGWHHNYQWVLENSTTGTIAGRVPPSNYQPPSYTVDFPDGRTERFVNSPTDTDPYCRTTAGVRDRFQPLNLTTKLAYLILPDGGKVEFKATLRSQYEAELNITYYWYTYVPAVIFSFITGRLQARLLVRSPPAMGARFNTIISIRLSRPALPFIPLSLVWFITVMPPGRPATLIAVPM